ncbi:hypothetical protein FR483_N387R [Paramecium bursaria Chlorella virus FR483]|uniref:Uncharacterized protein N387R n=1 Tax=Paramecium bursaria Chlorella virus FR483 TaxID=399781 RepID=A7J791_PBCVF|nr:hypothetical protein FR483_N387R [Paramecium bursaria Chlorella virus FR483]ABT15672.1 hypothetical protein FR483_N387R [Paramecium bursaria Chlorella virus FR483]
MLVTYKDDDYFPYDITMFWEFFRWERYKLGHIYLQCFKNGKLYAGQSIQIIERMRKYSSGKGSNPHHTNAIEKHGWWSVDVLTIKCPWYMLDTIEKFLIEYYDLTDPKKGYNKTTGGRKIWTHSKETRAKMSERLLGEKNPMYGKTHTEESKQKMREAQTGAKNPMYGHTWAKTPEQIAKTSGQNNGMFAKTGIEHYLFNKFDAEHPAFGTKRTPEQIVNISGKNNHNSKPICVFGKAFPAASVASNALRAEHAPKSNRNFINDWTRNKQHKPYTFYITKEFYKYATENNLENITRDFYDKWLIL